MKRLPRISLTCKLVPVQYREYENGLLKEGVQLVSHLAVFNKILKRTEVHKARGNSRMCHYFCCYIIPASAIIGRWK